MLYLASTHAIRRFESDVLQIEDIPPEYSAVEQWFMLPHRSFAGAHTGCSCGFPYVVSAEPFEYYEGWLDTQGDDEHHKDVASLRSLLDVIGPCLISGGVVELLPVWNGDEADPPNGTIELHLSQLTPETFVFTEGFLHRITQ